MKIDMYNRMKELLTAKELSIEEITSILDNVHEDGYREGYNKGYEAGTNDGEGYGYDKGYEDGQFYARDRE